MSCRGDRAYTPLGNAKSKNPNVPAAIASSTTVMATVNHVRWNSPPQSITCSTTISSASTAKTNTSPALKVAPRATHLARSCLDTS